MEIVLYILVAMAVLGLIIFIVEVKNATLIDDNEPFLHGDYDPKKDPIIPYEETFCKKCEYFDGYDMCLLKANFGSITYLTINKCKNDSLFEVKNAPVK